MITARARLYLNYFFKTAELKKLDKSYDYKRFLTFVLVCNIKKKKWQDFSKDPTHDLGDASGHSLPYLLYFH